jgi:hypothetical protein
MGVIRIEPEPSTKEAPCEACGGTNRLMHGYVRDDELAHGVYFLEWCDGDHPQNAAFLTLGWARLVTGPTHRIGSRSASSGERKECA